MGWKTILSAVFALVIIALLLFYFAPFNKIDFNASTGNFNFSLTENSKMQYYPNLRFATPEISYQISDCSLQKKNEMQYAFDAMEDITILKFNPVDSNPQISITCEEKRRIENGMFVAGEGGPTNISVTGNFYVILSGEILLLRESQCTNPNVATHELLHVLGFNHSSNPENIMYNLTNCNQVIGDDIINRINELYSIPSYPDLMIENASASIKGRFLDLETTIRNAGLDNAKPSKLIISMGENVIREADLGSIRLGQGLTLTLTNMLVPQINFEELTLEVEYSFDEITKENNKIKLEIKD